MSTLTAWLFAALAALPTPTTREHPIARGTRLAYVAAALGHAVDVAVMTGALPGHERRQWAAAALATAIRESGQLHLTVHEGSRRGDLGRSICFMQINWGNRDTARLASSYVARGRGSSAWAELAGVGREATRRCAMAGVLTLARLRARCARLGVPGRELLTATLSAYMHGSSCAPRPEGIARARLTRAIVSRATALPDPAVELEVEVAREAVRHEHGVTHEDPLARADAE
jgi:hypothetical protein